MFPRCTRWYYPTGDDPKVHAQLIVNAFSAGTQALTRRVGYLSDIRSAYDQLYTNLQQKYSQIRLNDLLNDPTNAARQKNLVEAIWVSGADQDELIVSAAATLWDCFENAVGIESVGVYIPARIEEPIALLALYGLDGVVTVNDDPQLWAAVVLKQWLDEAIRLKQMAKTLQNQLHNPSSLVADPIVALLAEPVPSDLLPWIGMYCFEVYTAEDSLDRIEKWCVEREKESFVTRVWTEADARQVEGSKRLALYSLAVSRPSRHRDQAWVSVSNVLEARSGMGQECLWVREGNGAWRPDKLLSMWVS